MSAQFLDVEKPIPILPTDLNTLEPISSKSLTNADTQGVARGTLIPRHCGST